MTMSKQNLIEGIDYHFEDINGMKYKVFTEHYHLKRGYCCKNKCRNCPYGFNKTNNHEKR